LQESFDTQRRFTADASHELRTPVTAIAGHVNYLLRRTKTSPEQLDSLIVIKREAERMGKLVADLLELARADAGFRVDRRKMNLVEVAEAVHMEIAPVAGQAARSKPRCRGGGLVCWGRFGPDRCSSVRWSCVEAGLDFRGCARSRCGQDINKHVSLGREHLVSGAVARW
jgi:signal transduction histidine kinase